MSGHSLTASDRETFVEWLLLSVSKMSRIKTLINQQGVKECSTEKNQSKSLKTYWKA
jgi:hypothetical protein